MPLPTATIEEQKLSQVGSSPFLYRFSPYTNGGEVNQHAIFVTSVRECGFGRKSPSLVATTRRLLVGLNSLQLHDQKQGDLSGHNVVTSRISGRIDQQSVELITYAINHDDCVTDVIGWLVTQDGDSALDLKLAENIEPIATEVVKEIDANSSN